MHLTDDALSLRLQEIKDWDLSKLDARRAEIISQGQTVEALPDNLLKELVAISAQCRLRVGKATKPKAEPKPRATKKATSLEDLAEL